jgi:hypothetical protein
MHLLLEDQFCTCMLSLKATHFKVEMFDLAVKIVSVSMNMYMNLVFFIWV